MEHISAHSSKTVEENKMLLEQHIRLRAFTIQSQSHSTAVNDKAHRGASLYVPGRPASRPADFIFALT